MTSSTTSLTCRTVIDYTSLLVWFRFLLNTNKKDYLELYILIILPKSLLQDIKWPKSLHHVY